MRILDLFCGAGGAAMGYHRAFPDAEIIGVDINPQPRYPFAFVQADALGAWPLGRFDLVHASPPCQHFTRYGNVVKDIKERYKDLIEPTRTRLEGSRLPYVIENVQGAPLRDPVRLCGSSFGLDVRRHRLFECSFPVVPPPCDHKWQTPRFPASTGRRINSRCTVEVGVWRIPLATQRAAMDIAWMELRELSEAIPPAYTEFIGNAFKGVLLDGVSGLDRSQTAS